MKIWINDIFYKVSSFFTIFQFCFFKNINLPCFCYHEKLTISGNCRICLVEVNGSLGVSCSLPLMDGMHIYTDNFRVRKAREGVLQFLLVNHPLDCPICDQGGECDLQDISLTFGMDRGRFYENRKRSFDNLNVCGPLIKTVMTRCIHCSRCVRFMNEISDSFELGILGRGNDMEIGTFVESFLDHELSGNIIDLCPVGALTSMPFSFVARSWELTSIVSVDIFDSLASSIRLDVVNNSVVRVVPFLDEVVNEEWITNKSRFSYDSFFMNRLLFPKLRLFTKFIVISWGCVLNLFSNLFYVFNFDLLEVLVGSFIDLSMSLSLKFFFSSLGCSNFNYFNSFYLNNDFRCSFLLNESLFNLEDYNIFVIIGVNIRLEAPLISSRIRQLYLQKQSACLFYSFGLSLNYLSFPLINLGNSLKSFFFFLNFKSFALKNFLNSSFLSFGFLNFKFSFWCKAIIILGSSLLFRLDSNFIYNSLNFFKNRICCFLGNFFLSFISSSLGFLSAAEVNLMPRFNSFFSFCNSNLFSFSFLYGVDNLDFFNPLSFIVFQGPFLNSNFILNFVNLLLPSRIFAEENFIYLNLEGRLRFTKKAYDSSQFVISDYNVILGLFTSLNYFFFRSFSILDNFVFVMSFFFNIIFYDIIFSVSIIKLKIHLATLLFFYEKSTEVTILNFKNFFLFYLNKFFNNIFFCCVNNFYDSDFFCVNSKTLSLCSLKSLKFTNSFSKGGFIN